MAIETTSTTQKYRERCEDRVEIIHTNERTVIVVADGAGGIGSGNRAAEAVIQAVRSNYESIHSADDWSDLLSRIDSQIHAGESTAIVVDIGAYGIAGASVGDSQALIFNSGNITDLTKDQIRKPLLGSGDAHPTGFTSTPLHGLLLVATDGLFDYAKREAISSMVEQTEFYEIPRTCIEMVRLPSGDLWDDIGIVARRNKPQRRTKQTYEL